jgi:ribosome modulation factor
MDISKALQQGYDACWRGEPIEANPYLPRDPRKRAWSRGWKQAEGHKRYHRDNPQGEK